LKINLKPNKKLNNNKYVYCLEIRMIKKIIIGLIIIIISLNFSGCISNDTRTRDEAIPDNAVKITPDTDLFPPQLHSDEYDQPVPMTGPINTAGAEDSPFIPCCDEETFYFFFTPDVNIPIEEQLLDGVTGIYISKKVNDEWIEPERIILQYPWKLSLDGCTFVQDDIMWFCTAREGYTGIHWFTAEYINDKWKNWKNADFDPKLDVGELHFYNNFTELYYHSGRAGGKGGNDIWFLKRVNNQWQDPVNIEKINTEENEGYPYITPDGNELWFNRWYLGSPAIFRSKKTDGEWQEPELIISQFAGEPTLDKDGNIYFVHHFYEDGVMIEADIYISYRMRTT
jgi:hypothetical protein